MSVAKQFTAALVLERIERGQLALTTPVADVIPEFGARGKARITVAHLLTHTSGLPMMLPPMPLELAGDLSAVVAATAACMPEFEPGSRVSYCVIVGHAVLAETITLLRQWWRAPHTASSDPGDQLRVRNWERTIHPVQASPPIYLAAAGMKAVALAGRLADGIIFNNLTSDEALGRRIEAARAAAVTAGRDPERLAFILRTHVIVTDDPAPWLERQKNAAANLDGVFDRLQTRRIFFPFVVPEISMARARRDNQIIKRNFRTVV